MRGHRGGGVAISLTADGKIHKNLELQWYSVLYLVASSKILACVAIVLCVCNR